MKNSNMKLWKYSGTFFTATGVIHTIYALFLGADTFAEMIRDGLINSTGEIYIQAFAFWFFVCGIILILWRKTLQHYIKKEQIATPLFLEVLYFGVCCGWMYHMIYHVLSAKIYRDIIASKLV